MLDANKKRLTFLGIVGFLVLVIVISVIYVNLRTPTSTTTNGGTSVVSDKKSDDGLITIKDVNDGEMQIPKYNIAESSYDMSGFTEESGIVAYNGESRIGITVSSKEGTIDWEQVKKSGVSFVYIRVAYRGVTDGKIYYDTSFQDNMLGAAAAGIDLGVFFRSRAISELEAEQEAAAVLDKIALHQVTYPISFVWKFTPEDEVNDGSPRTQGCTADQVTRFAKSFCDKIKQSGRKATIMTDKQMGYEYFNLEALKDCDIWYVEYKKQPAFHYNFTMWEYSSEGTVAGIDSTVKMSYAFLDYAK